MKKYRCPHCGEECIKFSDIVFYNGGAREPLRVMYWGNKCNSCNKFYRPASKKKVIWTVLENISFILPFVFLLLGFLLNNVFIYVSVAYLIIVNYVLINFVNVVNSSIVEFDELTRKFVIPSPNVELTIYDTKKNLEHLDIYGLRFDNQTKAVKFHETFTNGLVPVVFHRKKKDSLGLVRARLMKIEFIPEELLYEGAEFTIVDNGEEIAKGKISCLYNSGE